MQGFSQLLEAMMLICFGISWPIAIVKTLKTRQVTGKSPLFMGVILLGYCCGLLHKVLNAVDWVALLYAFNFLMVSIELGLYYHFLPGPKPMSSIEE